MALTEESILDIREEIVSRCNANDRMFDKFIKKLPAKFKAKFPELQDEFLDFFFNNIHYQPKDIRRVLNSLYEREILKHYDHDEEL